MQWKQQAWAIVFAQLWFRGGLELSLWPLIPTELSRRHRQGQLHEKRLWPRGGLKLSARRLFAIELCWRGGRRDTNRKHHQQGQP